MLFIKIVWMSSRCTWRSFGLTTQSYSISSSHYNLIVVGGGSGGLACAKEAAGFQSRVAVVDFVKPSIRGTTWGLGGTCVNVGCIPKKLMHHVARFGSDIISAQLCGWPVEFKSIPQVDWNVMSEKIQNYIRSLNWGYRVQMREKNITYLNGEARFIDKNTIVVVDKQQKETYLTADNFAIAVGSRPSFPNFVGANEHCITSDDLFWLQRSPGKTLVIGGSYVALECAGFLHGFGFPTELMIRSIPLRGFDQQMARLVVQDLELTRNIKIHWKCVPQKIIRMSKEDPLGPLKVTWMNTNTEKIEEAGFDTVLLAVGRTPVTATLNLDAAGVAWNALTNQKIRGGYGNEAERTSQSHIYALGDVLENGIELTPVAIRAGKYLARRLFGAASQHLDYSRVPTTVFTPLEYSCFGLSEEDALLVYGENNIEIYHSFYKPLEQVLSGYDEIHCYVKVIVRISDETILGFHLTAINAGEIAQGFSLLLTANIRWSQLQSLIGIHPTSAEEVTKLHITKRSNLDPQTTQC